MISKINNFCQSIILIACIIAYCYMIYSVSHNNLQDKLVSTSKVFFHIFNLLILIIMLLSTIFYKVLEPLLRKNFKFLTHGTGKGLVVACQSMYFVSYTEFTFIFMGVVFISGSVGLYLFDQIFNCNTYQLSPEYLSNNSNAIDVISSDLNDKNIKASNNKENEENVKKADNPYDIPEDF